jgi:YVTN family beta-propeller protein
VGTGPWGAALSPDGQRLYVANYGASTVDVIDSAGGNVIATVDGMDNPVHLAVTPDGGRVFVACQAANAVRVIDTATAVVTTEIAVGVGPRNMVISPDGLTAYVSEEGSNAISVIDTAASVVTDRVTGFFFPRVPAITSDGRRLFVPNYGGNTVDVLDTAALTTIASVPGFSLPFAVALSSDGRTAYVSGNGDGSVRALDTTTYAVIESYRGLNTPYWVAVTPDSASVYVANHGNSTVSILPGTRGLHPNQGPTGGGTPVTIIGVHLSGATAVHFGNRLATHVTVVNDNEITAVTPAGQGVVNVTVTTSGGTSNAVPFYYLPPPHLASVTPSSGPTDGGTAVTLNGFGLYTARKVNFGTMAVTPVIVSDNTITVTAPPQPAGAVPVIVTTVGGIADDATYTYLGAGAPG